MRKNRPGTFRLNIDTGEGSPDKFSSAVHVAGDYEPETLTELAWTGDCWAAGHSPEHEPRRLELSELGIEVSLMGAKSFRDGAFAEHIEKMRRAKELALQLREVGNADAAGSIADAGALVLMQQVYDALTKGDEVDFDTFSKIIARLRSGDHRLREVNAKLREYERREAEWERKEAERESAKAELSKAISKRGIGEDVMREIEEKIKLL